MSIIYKFNSQFSVQSVGTNKFKLSYHSLIIKQKIQSVPELPPHRKQACANNKIEFKMTKIKFPVAHISELQSF
jgi:hypothetical protein